MIKAEQNLYFVGELYNLDKINLNQNVGFYDFYLRDNDMNYFLYESYEDDED